MVCLGVAKNICFGIFLLWITIVSFTWLVHTFKVDNKIPSKYMPASYVPGFIPTNAGTVFGSKNQSLLASDGSLSLGNGNTVLDANGNIQSKGAINTTGSGTFGSLSTKSGQIVGANNGALVLDGSKLTYNGIPVLSGTFLTVNASGVYIANLQAPAKRYAMFSVKSGTTTLFPGFKNLGTTTWMEGSGITSESGNRGTFELEFVAKATFTGSITCGFAVDGNDPEILFAFSDLAASRMQFKVFLSPGGGTVKAMCSSSASNTPLLLADAFVYWKEL